MSEDLKKMPSQYLACSHPLLLPVLMIEEVLNYTLIRLLRIHGILSEIEGQTGFGDIEPRQVQDYQTLVRALGKQNSIFAYTQAVVYSAQLHLRFLQQKLHRLDNQLPDMHKQKLEDHSISLRERMEFLASNIEHMLLYYGIEMRLETQKTVVCQ
jgi:hypothetical protein